MASQANQALPAGSRLENYRVVRTLASGGFSFVYLARFRYGMKCFFEEGRALARLQHPNVVRVVNFFRANDTVYLVMRYERGRSLESHIKSRRGALEELWFRTTFAQ